MRLLVILSTILAYVTFCDFDGQENLVQFVKHPITKAFDKSNILILVGLYRNLLLEIVPALT